MIKAWIEAMRLRTLPVSVAGVLMAIAYAVAMNVFDAAPALIALTFAVLAQIASNFANEYYDYAAGLDKAGREGPRRGVTEGDITPRAMLTATWATLGVACAVGLSLIHWGGWWLLPMGMLIAAGAVAYSTGPYPLSHHGLGEVAVVLFFGVVPVCLTYYLQSGYVSPMVAQGSLAMGLMGANVLLVNNYRDADDDAAVGKHTLAVLWGRPWASRLYLAAGILAAALLASSVALPGIRTVAAVYLAAHLLIWNFMRRHRGAALNPVLGITAMEMLAVAAASLILAAGA